MLNIGKISLCADAEKGTRFSLIHETNKQKKKRQNVCNNSVQATGH